MTRFIFAALLATLTACSALAVDTTGWRESDYRDALCAGMRMEVSLGAYGRADCMSDTHAIEIDWTDKFKQGVGQALTYSQRTDLTPGLVLICRRSEALCLQHSLAAQETLSAYGAAATVWECGLDSVTLDDCVVRHIAARP